MQRREGRLRRGLWCTSLQLKNCKVCLLVNCASCCLLEWDGSMGSIEVCSCPCDSCSPAAPSVHLHQYQALAPSLPTCLRWCYSSAPCFPPLSPLWSLSASFQHDLSTWLCWGSTSLTPPSAAKWCTCFNPRIGSLGAGLIPAIFRCNRCTCMPRSACCHSRNPCCPATCRGRH